MALYASSHTRSTQRVDLATLGAISAPLLSLATDQLFVAQRSPAKGRGRPAAAQAQPMAVQSSTSVPSGQRT